MRLDPTNRPARALVLASALATGAAPLTVRAEPPPQDLNPVIIEEASIAFQEGAEEYDLGHYDKAIDRFEDAFRLTRNPALHYNLGQAYWKRYDVEPDLAYLRRSRLMFSKYLAHLRAAEPDSKDIREVESYIEKLTAQIEEAQEPAPDEPAVVVPAAEGPEPEGRANPPPPAPDEHPQRLGPAGLAGAGIALVGLVGGGATAGVGVVSSQRLSQQKADEQDHPDWTDAREKDFDANIRKSETMIYIGAGAGGVLLITGVVMVLLDAKKQQAKNSAHASTRIRPELGPSSVGVRF